jgi:hypothetical protein
MPKLHENRPAKCVPFNVVVLATKAPPKVNHIEAGCPTGGGYWAGIRNQGSGIRDLAANAARTGHTRCVLGSGRSTIYQRRARAAGLFVTCGGVKGGLVNK